MNKDIKKYLETCKEKFNEINKIREEVNKIKIPDKKDYLQSKNEMDFIQKYMKEKEDILKIVLATLFKNNSVVIEGNLSLRNGLFKEYRQQNECSLANVKTIIYRYANYLKLNDEEKNVLDFCLKIIDYNEYDEYRGLRSLNDMIDKKQIKLGEINYILDDEKSFKSFEVIELYPNGDIEFVDDEANNGSRKRRYSYYNSDNFTDEEREMLVFHFKDEINKMKNSFDKELIEMRLKLEKDIAEIKEKCGKYLLVASLGVGE